MITDSKLGEALERKHKYGTTHTGGYSKENEELQRVKDEMAELYRSKCQNDQRLINANHAITEYERKTSELMAE